MIRKQPILLFAVVLGTLILVTHAEDAVTSVIAALRVKCGQAIVRENEITLRWLEGALGQARIQKNAAEVERLEILIEELKTENAQLRATGDKRALLPTNQKELRAFLIGTLWAFDGTLKNAYEFLPDGSFKAKKETFQYVVVGGRRGTSVWSATTKVDCDLNEDGTTLTEVDGARGVLKRVR